MVKHESEKKQIYYRASLGVGELLPVINKIDGLVEMDGPFLQQA